jgi:cell division protein FtsW (lipid II flippase)
MVIIQGDLGAGWLIYWCFLGIFYLRTRRKRYAISGLILFLLAVLLAYRYSDLVKIRLHGWIDPWFTPDSNFYQISQAWTAMSSGGITGTGLGSGTPQYIPLGHSDFIFASIVTEWGYIGGIAIVILLMTLIYRIFRSTTLLPRHSFSALLNTGIALLFLIQAIVNIGGVLRILPLTGVPLIFVSYGGSAMMIAYLSMGYVLSSTKQ